MQGEADGYAIVSKLASKYAQIAYVYQTKAPRLLRGHPRFAYQKETSATATFARMFLNISSPKQPDSSRDGAVNPALLVTCVDRSASKLSGMEASEFSLQADDFEGLQCFSNHIDSC